MRGTSVILVTISLAGIVASAGADENKPAADVPELDIEIDRTLVRALSSPDAVFIRVLHDQSKEKLLTNLGISTRDGVATEQFQKKRLVFHGHYTSGGERRHVFVYDQGLHSWPGVQPQTVVICDASYRPLEWKEVGGSPMFDDAALDFEKPQPVLRIIRRHRHTILPNPKRRVYRYSLKNDAITLLPNIEWLYKNEEERARYSRWRKALLKAQ